MSRPLVAVVVRYCGPERRFFCFDQSGTLLRDFKVPNHGQGGALAREEIAKHYRTSDAPWAAEIQRRNGHGDDISEGQFKVGDRVYLVHVDSYGVAAPHCVDIREVVKVTRCSVVVRGRHWSDGSGKHNPDERYRIVSANVAKNGEYRLYRS